MLICMQKINFITNFFLKILQRNSKIATWVIWAWLATHNQNDSINLKKALTFICWQKINFILCIFLEILQRYCKLVILGFLGMPGYPHTKWYHKLIENIPAYLQAKNQLHALHFSGDIGKIWNFILSTLSLSGDAHPKW